MSEKEYKEIKCKLDEILKILNGNGETGMCAKVNILWKRYDWLMGALIIQAVALIVKFVIK